MNFNGRAILLDIEGTTSSISFVHDVMYSYARRELDRYLAEHWGDPKMLEARDAIARDAGQPSFADWVAPPDFPRDEALKGQRLVREEVHRLMDRDAKTTGLKLLQGMIWEEGFRSGELQAHLFDDVRPAIERWRSAGIDVRIYSSGSVQAQKLFFGYSVQGNLLPLLGGHYDTNIGHKREAESYRRIAADMNLPPAAILFLSDIVAELDAAREAGLQTGLMRRPGNAEPPVGHGHPELTSFADITVSHNQAAS
jgi:enolase-phosphatase E1